MAGSNKATQTASTWAEGMERLTSIDGATIAFRRQGQGDPVLLVHGGPSTGEAWAQVTSHLESRFTVVAMDRRGRGASTDGDGYSLDREAADVAAVAEELDGQAHVVAHSSGARVALLAAMRGARMRSLMLYEPPLALEHMPPGLLDRLDELIDSGDRPAAAELFMSEIATTPDELAVIKSIQPAWERVCAAIPTAPREGRAMIDTPVDLAAAGGITVPVLFLVGEKTTSPIFLDGLDELEGSIPGARRESIPGQHHMATAFAAEALAERVDAFITSID